MIKAMPEATKHFLDDEERGRQERLEMQRAKAAISAACAKLDVRYGGTHAIGSADNEYNNLPITRPVDIDRKRYARLQGNMRRVVCVPWIDAFAERVGRKFCFAGART